MDRALRDLLRTERHRGQVEERRRRNALRRQAEESLSLREVLDGFAARSTAISVHTACQRTPAPSVVCELGRDYVALRAEASVVRLVPLAAVAAIRSTVPAAPGAGVRSMADLDLAERLRELAGIGASVRAMAAGSVVSGRLRSVGHDVVVIEASDGSRAAVALGRIDELEVGS